MTTSPETTTYAPCHDGVLARVHSLFDGVDIANPLCKGNLYKEAHTHIVFHRRFFVLFPKILVYYEKEAEYIKDAASGTLKHRHRAILLNGLYLSKPEKKPKGAKYCFILHAPDKKNGRQKFLLVSHTREERKMWVERLQEQNPTLLEPTMHSQESLISPDTPQPPSRKIRPDRVHIRDGTGNQIESPLSASSLATVPISVHNCGDYPARPGSPRHDVVPLPLQTSPDEPPSSHSHDFLDIAHLNISDGHSDFEDN